MPRFAKWSAATISALILLFGVAQFLVSRIVRKKYLAAIEQQMGQPVSVDHIGLAWPLSLHLTQVQLGTSVKIPSLRIGREGVVLEKPVVHLPDRPVTSPRDKVRSGRVAAAFRVRWPRRVTARDATLLLPFGRVEAQRVAVEFNSQGEPMRVAARGARVALPGVVVDDLVLYAERRWDGSWRTEARANGARLHWGKMASQPIGPFALEFLGIWSPGGWLRLREGDLRLGALQVSVDVDMDWSHGQGRVSLARVNCQDALASLPLGLAPALEGMQLEGELEVAMQFSLDAQNVNATELNVFVPAQCRVVADSPMAPVSALLQRGIPIGRLGLVPDPLDRMGRTVPAAMIAAEDARFYSHDGFDWEGIRLALGHDYQAKRFARGASTISQQLVKNLYLTHDRNLGRKLEEAVLTWRLESVVPKKRILESYLAIIELGPGIWGAQAAAQNYFGRNASELLPEEAAHLAALAPAPVAYARKLDGQRLSDEWLERVRTILFGMRRAGAVGEEEWLAARERPLRIFALEPRVATATYTPK